MCKFFKKIWDFMIQIGNTVISAITVGNSTVTRIDVESTQVYPSVQPSIYINLNPTTVQPWNGYYRTGTITVDTNASSWTVEASSTPSGNYFTAEKTNSTTVTWTMQANDTTTSRVGYVTVRAGSVSAQTTVYQNTGYVIWIDNTSPAVVNSGATTLAISVWSKYGNEAVPVTYQITGNDWVRYVSMTDAGGGHYIYNFSIDQNTDTQARYNGVTFTQTLGESSPYKSASIGITQRERFVPDQISGFTMYANDGQWMLGRYKISEQQMGDYGLQPIYAIAVLRATVPPYDYTVNYAFDSYYGVPGPTIPLHFSNTVNRTVSQDTASPVTIPGGGTGYGWIITSYPNLQPPSNITFSVTRTV